jgi:membrane fusion protein, macrolide-specific efflux system
MTATKRSAWVGHVFSVKGLVAALVLAGVGWGVKTQWFPKAKPPEVITAAVERGDIEDTVLATGTIRPIKQVSVGAQVSGQIRKLHVKLGDELKKGDPIAEIDPVAQQNALKNAEAAIRNIQAQRLARLASLDQAELTLKRQQDLAQQDATSRQSLEEARAAVATLRAEVKALDAQIEQQSVSADTAKVNLGYARIVAPMDGVVSALVAEEGRTVNAVQSAPVMIKLADVSTVTIKAQISEADVVRVKPGLPVYFTILGDTRSKYEARLRAIEPTPESEQTETTTPVTNTTAAVYYNGLFEVPNPDRRLRVAMTAQVSIVLDKADSALLIPASALGKRNKNGQYEVKVLVGEGEKARVEARQVKVGLNNRVQAQVLDGLKEGELVVVGEAAGDGKKAGGAGSPPRMF